MSGVPRSLTLQGLPRRLSERELAGSPPLDGHSVLMGAVATHALSWLVVGCSAGLLLAGLLLAPRVGDAALPWSYGQWVPVHYDAQLYGWLALPFVGLLLRLYLPAGSTGRGRAVLLGWTAALAFGCASLLAGRTTSKPFLEWNGPARWGMVGELAWLWTVLWSGYRATREDDSGGQRWLKGGLLLALGAMPAVMAVATDSGTYPPINPLSGGPTGNSLLGSSLGLAACVALIPWLLRRGTDHPGPAVRRSVAVGWLLILHFGLFFLLGGGGHSHHERLQIAALASFAPWPLLLLWQWRAFRWPAPLSLWIAALAGWATLLSFTAPVIFLPGVLERWKFTHVLVAHAHVAMAGLCSSLGALVLAALLRSTPFAAVLGARRPFLLWHGGTLLWVLSIFGVGLLEAGDPGVLFWPDRGVTVLFAVRGAAGVAMLAAAVEWLTAVRRAGRGAPA